MTLPVEVGVDHGSTSVNTSDPGLSGTWSEF